MNRSGYSSAWRAIALRSQPLELRLSCDANDRRTAKSLPLLFA
jgi:hypothetical protein